MVKTKNHFQKKRMKDLIFCALVLAVPVAQFIIFYLVVNFNSIIMAFQRYENGKFIFNGLQNFRDMWMEVAHGSTLDAIKNSIIVYFCSSLLGLTLSLVFSFYIYKKMPFSKTFRVVLYLPSILSSMVTVTVFKQLVEIGVKDIFSLQNGLLSNPDTKMGTLIFFQLLMGFGTQILMYSGAMNGIDDSAVEAARLDGVNTFQEFFYITLPLIYPTIVTFLVVGMAGMFTNQLNLYAFYGNGGNLGREYWTVGFMLFQRVNTSKTLAEYPLLATYGMTLTLIAAPMTLLFRKGLEKFGPSLD
ncbi:MAG: sugar ABC transporter permease [Clostridia bacterium]|nr:sugar ABC transporter permease [Clostridia bacterium]